MIEVIGTVPAAPQAKRTEINAHLKERIVATKVKALTAQAGERPTTMAATPSHSAHEKAMSTANTQTKTLTGFVKSLLGMTEEQEEHTDQLEALTKTFTQQIERPKHKSTYNHPQVHRHRMRRSPVRHRAANQAMCELSPR
jgi:hypothetical protein